MAERFLPFPSKLFESCFTTSQTSEINEQVLNEVLIANTNQTDAVMQVETPLQGSSSSGNLLSFTDQEAFSQAITFLGQGGIKKLLAFAQPLENDADNFIIRPKEPKLINTIFFKPRAHTLKCPEFQSEGRSQGNNTSYLELNSFDSLNLKESMDVENQSY